LRDGEITAAAAREEIEDGLEPAAIYPDQAVGLTEAPAELATALLVVRGFWATALDDGTET
jgi:hypothetical protein